MVSTAHLKVPALTKPLAVNPPNAAVIDRKAPAAPSDIKVPLIAPAPDPSPAATKLSEAEFDSIKAGIGEMLDASAGANSNERVVILIKACISSGIDTAGWIISVAKCFNFKREHVGSVLTKSTARSSKTPLWSCDAEKRYSLLG
jgi:hypothetical protein